MKEQGRDFVTAQRFSSNKSKESHRITHLKPQAGPQKHPVKELCNVPGGVNLVCAELKSQVAFKSQHGGWYANAKARQLAVGASRSVATCQDPL